MVTHCPATPTTSPYPTCMCAIGYATTDHTWNACISTFHYTITSAP